MELDHDMNSTNITIKVDATLAKDAKVFAAQWGLAQPSRRGCNLETLVRGPSGLRIAQSGGGLAGLRQGYDIGGDGKDELEAALE